MPTAPSSFARFALSILLLAAWIGLFPWTAMAQFGPPPTSPSDEWHFRFDLFQMLLEERGLTTLDSFDDALADPQRSVVVIAGQLDRLPVRIRTEIRNFVRLGGSLLIASESSQSSTIRGIGTFTQTPVTTSSPKDQYQGFVDCLRIRNLASKHPLMAGVSEIVTNRSCWFAPQLDNPTKWEVVASLPNDCTPSSSSGKPLIAVGEMIEKNAGKLIVSADASLFTNNMLWHGDNAVFAIRTSELLCSTPKNKLVFLTDGQPLPSYREKLNEEDNSESQTPPPSEAREPELEKLLRLANAALKNVAESNVLNEALRQQPRSMPPKRYLQIILVFLSLVVVLWIFWRLLQAGALQSVFSGARTMRSAFEIKSRARLDTNDYRNPAGYLAREFCWELTGSRRSADWQRYLVDLQDSSRTLPLKGSDRKKLAIIVDLASRGGQTPISNYEFNQLGQTISELRAHVRKGETLKGVSTV